MTLAENNLFSSTLLYCFFAQLATFEHLNKIILLFYLGIETLIIFDKKTQTLISNNYFTT